MGRFRRTRIFHHVAQAAQVVLQIVDAPVGICLSVLFFMAIAALIFCAGLGTRGGVNSQLQSFSVNVVGQGLHVRKLAIGMKNALGVALTLPGVVNVDVNITGVAHSAGDHSVGLCTHCGVVNFVAEMVPAVPAHGRGGSNLRGLGLHWRQQQSENRRQNKRGFCDDLPHLALQELSIFVFPPATSYGF